MAQLWKLPVIYVCENNQYNEYTHHSETTAGSILTRAEGFGLLAVEVDGQNVREVYATAQRLVERARQGEGSAFMLCHTYRYLGHHVGDINREYYRSKEEELEWKTQRDPLRMLAGWLKTKWPIMGFLNRLKRMYNPRWLPRLSTPSKRPSPLPKR